LRLQNTRQWYGLMAVVLILGVGWIWVSRVTKPAAVPQALSPAPQVGHPAPDFTLPILEGLPMRLSDLRGHPVIINFWATWCPPCRAELAEIQAVHEQYADQGLVVLGVDVREDIPTVSAFVKEIGLTYPILLDMGLASNDYLVRLLPTTFFVDRQGIIRAVYSGPMNAAILEERLRSIYP